MNKNMEKQKKKEEAIRAAIRELHHKGALSFPKNVIVETTKTLYKDHPDSDYIVHPGLFSKPYYKENLDKWIREETGRKNTQLNKAQKRAREVKEKNVMEKYKKLEKDAFKIVDGILKGKIECKKFTKSFLLEEVNKLYRDDQSQNVNEEYGKTTFTDKKYEQIFRDAQTKLVALVTSEDLNKSQKNITALEYSKLQQENKRLNLMNKNLLSKLFTVYEGDEELLSENDVMYSRLISTILDSKKLFAYLKFYEEEMRGQKSINAYNFVKEILEKCTTKVK